MKTLGIIIVILGLCGLGYYYLKKRKAHGFSYETKIIDGTLNFADIVAHFKSLNLEKGKDTPFIARNGKFGQFKEKTHRQFPEQKEGYVSVIAAVYDEKSDSLNNALVLYAKQLDDETEKAFGDSELVVLS